MTLPPGEFYPHEFFLQLDLGRRVDSRWTLPQISSFYGLFCLVADDVHNGRYVGPDIINGCDRQADE